MHHLVSCNGRTRFGMRNYLLQQLRDTERLVRIGATCVGSLNGVRTVCIHASADADDDSER